VPTVNVALLKTPETVRQALETVRQRLELSNLRCDGTPSRWPAMRNLRRHAVIVADWTAGGKAPGHRVEQSSLTQRNVHCHRTRLHVVHKPTRGYGPLQHCRQGCPASMRYSTGLAILVRRVVGMDLPWGYLPRSSFSGWPDPGIWERL
jgi:hypothetical protein